MLLLAIGVTYLALRLGLAERDSALSITGMLSIFYLIVFACTFESWDKLDDIIVRYREVFTSGEASFRRERGRLVPREEILKREMEEPMFVRKINGKPNKVMYRFRCAGDYVRPILFMLVMIFLPVILALIFNGFRFSDIHIGGSAIWLCIAVPVAPIYFIQFAIKTIYDYPRIYVYTEDGKLKRYKQKLNLTKAEVKEVLQIMPPICIILIVVLGVLAYMVYLMLLWIVMMGVSGFGIITAALYSRKRKTRQ